MHIQCRFVEGYRDVNFRGGTKRGLKEVICFSIIIIIIIMNRVRSQLLKLRQQKYDLEVGASKVRQAAEATCIDYRWQMRLAELLCAQLALEKRDNPIKSLRSLTIQEEEKAKAEKRNPL